MDFFTQGIEKNAVLETNDVAALLLIQYLSVSFDSAACRIKSIHYYLPHILDCIFLKLTGYVIIEEREDQEHIPLHTHHTSYESINNLDILYSICTIQ